MKRSMVQDTVVVPRRSSPFMISSPSSNETIQIKYEDSDAKILENIKCATVESNFSEFDCEQILRKKRKAYEVLHEQVMCLVRSLESFKQAIENHNQQQVSLQYQQERLLYDEELELGETMISFEDIANTEMRIEQIKQAILQQLSANSRFQNLYSQFRDIPFYSFDYLNNLIEFLVSTINRMERNFTVMSIANINLFNERMRASSGNSSEVLSEGFTTISSSSELSTSTSSSLINDFSFRGSYEGLNGIPDEDDQLTLSQASPYQKIGILKASSANLWSDSMLSPRKKVRFSSVASERHRWSSTDNEYSQHPPQDLMED